MAVMKVYGLTGGIGMGKSTSEKLLRERGVAIVDTDIIAHKLVEPNEPALEEIRACFGAEIIGGDGRLRRDELARRVFADTAQRRRLEEILHPRIRAVWEAQLDEWRAKKLPFAVVVIPLLFETDAAPRFDKIICAACSATSQMQRLQARGWDSEQITNRIASQLPAEKKMELAHYVVWTEAGFDVHAVQLERIIPRV